ncbi:unnamed protein product, partial [Ectocarpus sp. 8 AP-2014]
DGVDACGVRGAAEAVAIQGASPLCRSRRGPSARRPGSVQRRVSHGMGRAVHGELGGRQHALPRHRGDSVGAELSLPAPRDPDPATQPRRVHGTPGQGASSGDELPRGQGVIFQRPGQIPPLHGDQVLEGLARDLAGRRGSGRPLGLLQPERE